MELMNWWWLLIPASYALGTFPTAHIVAGFVGHDPTACLLYTSDAADE